MMGVRWPSHCPCCASRRILTYQADGSWWCCACSADSFDDPPTTVGGDGTATGTATAPDCQIRRFSLPTISKSRDSRKCPASRRFPT